MRVIVKVIAVSKDASTFQQERNAADNYDAVHSAIKSCFSDIWAESRKQAFNASDLVYSTYITQVA